MANQKILDKKGEIINEISEKSQKASSVILFEYQGLSVEETNALRRLLRENDSELKIYKNTLVKRAFNSLNIDLDKDLEGPKAIAFGTDPVAPIKTLSEFAKNHPALILKVGLVDGEIADDAKLKELSTIPSREGLLTMLASGLMGTVRDLSICLDLYSKDLEEK
ncbi:MAG: 50S ribosomal protein L10 [Bacilli bacterium]|nr:50S ribosomal protein L10 [Bacilli bacterium]